MHEDTPDQAGGADDQCVSLVDNLTPVRTASRPASRFTSVHSLRFNSQQPRRDFFTTFLFSLFICLLIWGGGGGGSESVFP